MLALQAGRGDPSRDPKSKITLERAEGFAAPKVIGA